MKRPFVIAAALWMFVAVQGACLQTEEVPLPEDQQEELETTSSVEQINLAAEVVQQESAEGSIEIQNRFPDCLCDQVCRGGYTCDNWGSCLCY